MSSLKINVTMQTRRRGNSTYLLKAAIDNPDCCIISGSLAASDALKKRYKQLLEELPVYKKFFRWLTGKNKKMPSFESVTSFKPHQSRVPVIVDLEAIITGR
jgi:hypothetical protein